MSMRHLMGARAPKHFAGHNPRQELDHIAQLLDRAGVPRVCEDETAEMSLVDRVRALIVQRNRARGVALRQFDTEPETKSEAPGPREIHISDLRYRA